MEAIENITNLESKKINSICYGIEDKRYRFHIPSYQRGYRWTSHVTKLLDDIYDFNEAKRSGKDVGSYYCLQPIIIKRRLDLDCSHEGEQPEIAYEVVDGQQRLTTVYILLKALNHLSKYRIFRISYERDSDDTAKREEFLRSIEDRSDSDAKGKVDFSYIYQAYKNTNDWLETKGKKLNENLIPMLHNVLLNEVKIIWYDLPDDVEKTKVQEKFRDINAGKIQLTQAELVKAMMLNSQHYQQKGITSDTVRMEQDHIARVWDDCERTVCKGDFWRFITCDARPPSKRMDFLLELYIKDPTLSTKEDGITTFFEPLLRNKDEVNKQWKGIRDTYRKIQDWFEDVSLYNYIGLLVNYLGENHGKQGTLHKLFEDSCGCTTPDFCKSVAKTIHEEMGITADEFDQLNYNDHRKKITWLLMLFNVKLMNAIGRRFNFDAESGWSVEHVFARKSDWKMDKIKETERKDWVERHSLVAEAALKSCEKSKLTEIYGLLSQMQKYKDGDDFESIVDGYFRLIETPKGDLDIMGNLALLERSDNSALSNNMFYDKRKVIIDMIENGRNIPVGTEKVFLKSFPGISTSLDFWDEEDRERYVKYMKKIIF